MLTSNRLHHHDGAACEPLESRTLLAAGDLDPAFDGDGKLTLAFPGGTLRAMDVAMQYADGKMIVVGVKGDNAAAARLNPDGSLDPSFGQGGIWEWPQTMIREPRGVAIQNDGKVVVAGKHWNPGDQSRMAVARLEAHGVPDLGFGVGGVNYRDVGDNPEFNDVALQRDGKIVAVGTALTGTIDNDYDYMIARFNEDGSIDNTFDGDGIRGVGFGDGDHAYSVAIDYEGTPVTNPRYGYIVAAGLATGQFGAARLRPNGSLDSTFDNDGKARAAFPGATGHAMGGVTIQPGGKVVLSGGVYLDSTRLWDFAMVRLTANGEVDTSFGPQGNGRVISDLGGSEVATDVTSGFLGGLLIAGYRITYGPEPDFQTAIAAYTSEGVLDTRFAGDGSTVVDYDGEIIVNRIATTGNFVAPIRRLVVIGGQGMTRLVDVGSLMSITSFDQHAHEQGQDRATFTVFRDEVLPTPQRVYLSVGGTARPPTGLNADYTGSGITFVHPLQGRTYVDIPANESLAFVTITPFDDTLVEGDEYATFDVSADAAYELGQFPGTALAIRDNDVVGGPTVTSARFFYETAPHRLEFRFNQDVSGSIDPADFQINGPAGIPAHTFAHDAITNTTTLTFTGLLPDGQYTARAVAAGIANFQGQPMPADHVLDFFFLQGDANHDARVNLTDFNILASNFGQSPRDFTQGDFNYDGVVNLADFNILVSRFGQVLAAPASARGGIFDSGEELPDDLRDLLN